MTDPLQVLRGNLHGLSGFCLIAVWWPSAILDGLYTYQRGRLMFRAES